MERDDGGCSVFVRPDIDTMELSESLRTNARSRPPMNCTDKQESEQTDLGDDGSLSSGMRRNWSCGIKLANLGELWLRTSRDLADLGV